MRNTTFFKLIAETSKGFAQQNAPSYAAAIAYHAVISLVPILLIATNVGGRLLGQDAAMQQVVATIEQVVGSAIANVVADLVAQQMPQSMQGATVALLAASITFYSASNVFRQLVIALNAIWGVTPPLVTIRQGVVRWARIKLRKYILGFVMVFGMILALIASLFFSLLIGHFAELYQPAMPLVTNLVLLFNFVVLPVILTLLCGVIFKVLPGVDLTWRDVWLGAGLTGCVLAIGEGIIGYYASRSRIPAYYGVAGSVVILMLWAYMSAYILLIGAEFTRVYTQHIGSKKP